MSTVLEVKLFPRVVWLAIVKPLYGSRRWPVSKALAMQV